jgi:glyoxylase-like metal-dependent hydrolase (beta-lactamase superfamily II)
MRLLLLWLGLLCFAQARAQEAAEFTLQELAPGVFAAIDRDGKAGANAGFVIGADSVAVIDSFYRESAARALLAAIRARTQLPIRYVINTHHHIDHVAGNAVFAEAGALIVAQRRVAGWLRAENLRLMGERLTPELRAQIEALPLPQLGYEDRMSLHLGGGRRLLLRHVLGHTGGDTVIGVSDANVIFMGDLLWRAAIPNLVDARPLLWRSSLAMIVGEGEVDSRYVPGHGGVASAQDLQDFADYLAELDRAVRDAGSDSEKALARLATRYGAWAYFKGLAAANVRDQLAEQEGRKRVPSND